jgi:hypothetical protein
MDDVLGADGDGRCGKTRTSRWQTASASCGDYCHREARYALGARPVKLRKRVAK